MSEKARFFGRLGFRETVLPRALVASFWGLCMQWAVLAMEALTMASLLGDNACMIISEYMHLQAWGHPVT